MGNKLSQIGENSQKKSNIRLGPTLCILWIIDKLIALSDLTCKSEHLGLSAAGKRQNIFSKIFCLVLQTLQSSSGLRLNTVNVENKHTCYQSNISWPDPEKVISQLFLVSKQKYKYSLSRLFAFSDEWKSFTNRLCL